MAALSNGEIVYFELDLDGQLNEFQERKEMGAEVLTMSIAEVPEGRQRTPYLVSGWVAGWRVRVRRMNLLILFFLGGDV